MARVSSRGLAAVLAAVTIAAAATPALADNADIRRADNSLSLGIGSSNLDYRETAASAKPASSALDDETGWLPTLNAGYALLQPSTGFLPDLYVRIAGSAGLGNTRYSGATLGGTPISATTKDEIYNAELQLGRAFPLGPDALLIPFLEGGYRYWDRNLGAATGVEDYQNGEIAVGILAQYSPLQRWVLSVSGAAGSTVLPEMDKSGGASGNMNFKLGATSLWRVRGGLGYRLTSHLEITASAEFLAFGYGASTVNSRGYYEPKSTTEQVTLLTGVSWQFH